MPHLTSPLSSPSNTALPVSPVSPVSSISCIHPHTAGRLSTTVPLPALAMLLAALLTACGGGGSGASPSPTYTASCADGSTRSSTISLAAAQGLCLATKPVDSTSNNLTGYAPILKTQPPDPGYVDAQKVVYDVFNKARGDCGFGYMTRNTKLDQAAIAHANYNVVNNVPGHYETVGRPGFTGVDPWARMTAAGYANYGPGSSEVGNTVWTYRPGETNRFVAITTAAVQLLTGPYHMAAILGNYGHHDIGIGMPIDVDVGQGYLSGYLIAKLGTPLGSRQQSLPEGDVRTYPCEGTTGTGYQVTGEDPNPVPTRNLSYEPIGQTIFVMAARGHTLTIVNVTLTGPDGRSLAVLPILNSTTDKSGRFIEPHYAAIMPDKPMLPMTKYNVLITGRDNNTPFTRQFSFTTGNTRG